VNPPDLRAAIARRLPEAESLLCELIAVRSTTGEEAAVIELMERRLRELDLGVERVAVPAGLRDDPDFSFREREGDYADRPNLVATAPGAGGGRSAILSTHMDTVPADDWPEAFQPVRQEGYVVGRGACDAKGQVATMWLAAAGLRDAATRLRGDLQLHLVIEEEIGGNGALAVLAGGYQADGAVVLEPTGLDVHPANRGAVWFRIRVEGRPAHMGRKHEGVSAVEKAAAIIAALGRYEERLVAESRGQPLFARYRQPVQVNVGVVRAGDWPSTVPASALIEGGVGFLPNKPMAAVMDELREVILAIEDPWLRDHFTLDFPKLRNDAYALAADHPIAISLATACEASGFVPEVCGWNVSCDARLYYHRGGMPTLVFGPGDTQQAHANDERIAVGKIAQAAEALGRFLEDWCGVV
jgi:acetylornithine deacetylase